MQDNDQIMMRHWIDKSDNALFDAKKGIDDERLDNAQNRLYYALFYIVSALAYKNKFATSKHSQLLGWFNHHYVHTDIIPQEVATIYKDTFENRQKCDYGFNYKPTKERLTTHFGEAQILIGEIKKMLTS